MTDSTGKSNSAESCPNQIMFFDKLLNRMLSNNDL